MNLNAPQHGWLFSYNARESHELLIGTTLEESNEAIQKAWEAYRWAQAIDKVIARPMFVKIARSNIRAMIDSTRFLIFKER